jgi:hypothetical protein
MSPDGDVLFLGATLLIVFLLLWALADAAVRPAAAFPVAGKLTKPIWMGIVGGLAVVTWFFGGISLFGFAGAVASIVYLVDVRPAVREIRPGGRWG